MRKIRDKHGKQIGVEVPSCPASIYIPYMGRNERRRHAFNIKEQTKHLYKHFAQLVERRIDLFIAVQLPTCGTVRNVCKTMQNELRVNMAGSEMRKLTPKNGTYFATTKRGVT
jgi:hypothetical protein